MFVARPIETVWRTDHSTGILKEECCKLAREMNRLGILWAHSWSCLWHAIICAAKQASVNQNTNQNACPMNNTHNNLSGQKTVVCWMDVSACSQYTRRSHWTPQISCMQAGPMNLRPNESPWALNSNLLRQKLIPTVPWNGEEESAWFAKWIAELLS